MIVAKVKPEAVHSQSEAESHRREFWSPLGRESEGMSEFRNCDFCHESFF